ncbi:hypothetical protein EXIGLDRAFT_137480 [Exidia glandulosa HHB12029]|uniref:Uncharacterized protein n=1 Tax=Exidia glandulosa HHB12029 TaxID=1314781 RepID=A0A166A9K4_EXIGL|nr:hypothetical protein EXIGLDRAFT_137480 [Exidia glandulosa HHB12029]
MPYCAEPFLGTTSHSAFGVCLRMALRHCSTLLHISCLSFRSFSHHSLLGIGSNNLAANSPYRERHLWRRADPALVNRRTTADGKIFGRERTDTALRETACLAQAAPAPYVERRTLWCDVVGIRPIDLGCLTWCPSFELGLSVGACACFRPRCSIELGLHLTTWVDQRRHCSSFFVIHQWPSRHQPPCPHGTRCPPVTYRAQRMLCLS